MRNPNRILIFLAALGALSIAALVPGDAQAASSSEMMSPNTLSLWRPGDPGQPLRRSGWVRSTSGKPSGKPSTLPIPLTITLSRKNIAPTCHCV